MAEQAPLPATFRDEDILLEDDVENIAKDVLNTVVGDNQWIPAKIDTWAANVVEGCIKKLAALQRPYKYIVTCNFSQLAGAGFHMAGTQRWVAKTDGRAAVAWNNQQIQCHVVIYYLAL